MRNKFLHFRIQIVFSFIAVTVLLLVAISCSKTPYNEYTHNEGIRPLPGNPWLPSTPYNYPNVTNNNLVTLGRVLFYDKNLSVDNSVSCGSCHQQANGFADNKAFSIGNSGQHTVRNAHALVNSNNSKFWDGRITGDTSGGGGYNGAQATPILSIPFQSHIELNMPNEDSICRKISSLSYYPYLFSKANATISLAQIETAIASYIGTITASNSLYDQAYPANGSRGTVTLSQIELDGMAIFNGKGMCSTCHLPANNFSGNLNQFEDIGLNSVYTDLGRGAISLNPSDNGKFHIPSLKNIALSAPYMHDGRFTTLTQVVNFFSDSIQSSPNLSSAFTANPVYNNITGSYTQGGAAVSLGLTAYEKSSLVAFLQTLTDNSLVTDIRYSDPFKH